MTPLERAARAAGEYLGKFGADVSAQELIASEHTALARAVLQAIREPSEGMMKAGDAAAWQGSDLNDGQPVIRNVFPAMIDAALEEG